MKPTRAKPDPIERSMEIALRPEGYVKYDDTWPFVQGLQQVKDVIEDLVHSQPDRAIQLVETFIAGCYEKAEEIDDSGGSFRQFVGDLFCTWIKSRQAAGAEATETAKQLLDCFAKDSHGYCYRMEEAVDAFGKKGLRVLAEVAREEWAEELGKGNGSNQVSSRLRWLRDILRAVYVKQRDAERYLEVAERMGMTPRDCEVLAEIHEKRGSDEEALAWIEGGLELEKRGRWQDDSSWGLPEKRRRLLKKLGRGEDALESAWAEFELHPSKHTYGTLIRYAPRGQQGAWRARALDIAAQADLDTAIDLYAEMKEWKRVQELVLRAKPGALEGLSHYTTEPIAKRIERMHPQAAGKLHCALGLRILDAKKSKYYDVALAHFEGARRCFRKAGMEIEWEDLVRNVRDEHARKTGFMPRFEELLSRGSAPREPSFLEKARRRRSRLFRTQ